MLEKLKYASALIGQGRTGDCIDFLLDLKQLGLSKEYTDAVILLRARHMNLKRDSILGIIDNSQKGAAINEINDSILNLINLIEDDYRFHSLSRDETANRDSMVTDQNTITTELIYFTKTEIICRLNINSNIHTIIFKTTYTENRLFVDHDLFTKKSNWFNYSKALVFNVKSTPNPFKLRINFSLWTGLISNFILSHNSIELIEKKLKE